MPLARAADADRVFESDSTKDPDYSTHTSRPSIHPVAFGRRRGQLALRPALTEGRMSCKVDIKVHI